MTETEPRVINYQNVPETEDFSGRPLRKGRENFLIYFPGFNWKGIILAGGAVLSILRGEKLNDFDFWVFGSQAEIVEKMVEVELYFRRRHKLVEAVSREFAEKYNRLYLEETQRSYSEAATPEEEHNRQELELMNKTPVPYKRGSSFFQMQFVSFPTVQLIVAQDGEISQLDRKLRKVPVENSFQLVESFDFSCCKCWFDGENIWGTREQVECLTKTGQLEVNMKFPSSISRIIKYHEKGFQFPMRTFLDLGINPRKIMKSKVVDAVSSSEGYAPCLHCQGRCCFGREVSTIFRRSHRLLNHNPELLEYLSQPVELTEEKIRAIRDENRYKRPLNLGLIVNSLEESLLSGGFLPVGVSRGDYYTDGSKYCSSSKVFFATEPESLSADLERTRVKQIMMGNFAWRLEMFLRDSFYKPGGPGFWKAVMITPGYE